MKTKFGNTRKKIRRQKMLDIHETSVFCNKNTQICPSCNIINSQCTCVYCKGCDKWYDMYCPYQQSGCGSQECIIVKCFSFNFQNNTLCKQHFAEFEISEEHFHQSIKFAPNVIKYLILCYLESEFTYYDETATILNKERKRHMRYQQLILLNN
jgi:hypothetical protein